MKDGSVISPNVCTVTFWPPCIFFDILSRKVLINKSPVLLMIGIPYFSTGQLKKQESSRLSKQSVVRLAVQFHFCPQILEWSRVQLKDPCSDRSKLVLILLSPLSSYMIICASNVTDMIAFCIRVKSSNLYLVGSLLKYRTDPLLLVEH